MFAFLRAAGAAVLLALGLVGAAAPAHALKPGAPDSGVVAVKSAYALPETVARLKADIAAKGIVLFSEIDQATLAKGANIALRPSTLLVFGNPGLGSHFITADPRAGLDWPVRLLVVEDENKQVWALYTDFGYIARRHGIADREAEFKMASAVVASITAAVAAK